jgi:voltage-gated potassium channel
VTGTGASPPSRLAARREVALVLGRTLVSVLALLVLYFVLPLDRPFGWSTLIAFLVGLVAITALVAWQVRSILRSTHPVLRGIETTAVTLTVFLQLFAVAYLTLSADVPGSFSEPLTRIDSLYFVMTTFATVGFGDITPVTEVARVLTTLQMVGDLILVGLVLRVVINAVRRGAERLTPGHRGDPGVFPWQNGNPPAAPPTAHLHSSPSRDEAPGNEAPPPSSS